MGIYGISNWLRPIPPPCLPQKSNFWVARDTFGHHFGSNFITFWVPGHPWEALGPHVGACGLQGGDLGGFSGREGTPKMTHVLYF